jgi:hypothetical protein
MWCWCQSRLRYSRVHHIFIIGHMKLTSKALGVSWDDICAKSPRKWGKTQKLGLGQITGMTVTYAYLILEKKANSYHLKTLT